MGGLQNVIHYWAEELSKWGHHITVITHTVASSAFNDEVTNYRIIRCAGRWQECKEMRGQDLVVLFNISLKAMPQLLVSRIPMFVSHHTALHFEGEKLPVQQVLKKWIANHVVAGHAACSNYIAKHYKRCKVIHSPFDDGIFYDRHLKRIPFSVLFTGRLVSDKGVDTLLRAFSVLCKYDNRFKLLIVGDGPERLALEQLADDLGISDRVGFTGLLGSVQVAELLNSHELVVVPSRMEPFGIVVLEALACGCKTIVSTQGGLPEAAGGLAALVPSNNPEALALAMVQQLQRPYPSADAVAKHLQNFTISGTALQFAQLLQSCIRK